MSVEAINTLEDLRRLRDTILALAEKYRARQVSVFGSIARGELQTGSDVDFLVDFEPDYKLRDHIRLTQALQSLVGRRVEVVDRRSLREELRATIIDDALEL